MGRAGKKRAEIGLRPDMRFNASSGDVFGLLCRPCRADDLPSEGEKTRGQCACGIAVAEREECVHAGNIGNAGGGRKVLSEDGLCLSETGARLTPRISRYGFSRAFLAPLGRARRKVVAA